MKLLAADLAAVLESQVGDYHLGDEDGVMVADVGNAGTIVANGRGVVWYGDGSLWDVVSVALVLGNAKW